MFKILGLQLPILILIKILNKLFDLPIFHSLINIQGHINITKKIPYLLLADCSATRWLDWVDEGLDRDWELGWQGWVGGWEGGGWGGGDAAEVYVLKRGEVAFFYYLAAVEVEFYQELG